MTSDLSAYWNNVANEKTFTHPLNLLLLEQYIAKDASILDYGCGYGRLVKELKESGFKKVTGVDFSEELIKRGQQSGVQHIHHISSSDALVVEDHSLDCILLFAVLTCIPDNVSQKALINKLLLKLKSGGILFISDYFLQKSSLEVERYSYLNDDKDNFGVFNMPDGGMFRHHTHEWIESLLRSFTVKHETIIDVNTMNGNKAEAFQLIALKP